MDEQRTDPPEHDDPRLEVLQAVYDRVSSYDDAAPPERIREELDAALEQAGVDLDEPARQRMTQHIDDRGGREDVARVL